MKSPHPAITPGNHCPLGIFMHTPFHSNLLQTSTIQRFYIIAKSKNFSKYQANTCVFCKAVWNGNLIHLRSRTGHANDVTGKIAQTKMAAFSNLAWDFFSWKSARRKKNKKKNYRSELLNMCLTSYIITKINFIGFPRPLRMCVTTPWHRKQLYRKRLAC